MKTDPIVILNAQTKDTLCRRIRALPDGEYRFRLVKKTKRRSLEQNAFYWGVVLPHVAAGMRDAWGETVTNEEVHEHMKARFLRRLLVDKRTGQSRGYTVGSTPKCDTKEFSDYLEQIAKFAASMLGVVIPDADPFHATARKPRKPCMAA